MCLIEHFEDLSPNMQEKLLNFIKASYSIRSTINYSVSAYGLKQEFINLDKSKEHVSTVCFKEAMEKCGFKSKLIGTDKGIDSNWHFNVYVLKHKR